MKIVKFKKLKANKYELHFDNDLIIITYDDIIVKYNLLVNKELDEKKLNELLNINDEYKAYYDSLSFINKKLRTEKEIINHLEKNFNSKIITNVINKLKKENYINDNIYITAFINDQLNLTSNGPLKIKSKLISLGYNEEEINSHLDLIENSIWQEKISKIIAKKIKLNRNYSSLKLKEKLTYDLINLGYDKNLFIELINNQELDDDNVLEKEFNKLYPKLSKKYQDKELEFQLINKLMSKGFNYNDIKEQIKKA